MPEPGSTSGGKAPPPGEVALYVDGGCQPNPGPGGYGVVLLCGDTRRELSGGFRRTTNNRMEILAVIAGLRALEAPCTVTVHSDSQYVVKAMSHGWARRWRARNWRRTETEPALNPDLWAEVLALCERHRVTFRWVRGHAGNPLNERCDQLATQARSGSSLPADGGYERPASPSAPAAPRQPTFPSFG